MSSPSPMGILEDHGDTLDPFIRPVLEAWRVDKKVYKFDPVLLDALWESPVEDIVPPRFFRRLPAPCVYVFTPGREVTACRIDGFFACSARDGSLEFVMEMESGLWTTTATLWPNTPTMWLDRPSDRISMPPLLSLMLFLCGDLPRRKKTTQEEVPNPQEELVKYKGEGTPRPGRWVLDRVGLGMIWEQ